MFLGVWLVISATTVEAKQRLKLYDITFPQPGKGQMKRLADIRIRSRRIAPQVFASTEIVFYLDQKGRVDSIGWSHALGDSLVFRPYQDSLLATRFEAGKIKGKKADFALVARLFVLGDRFGARGIVDLPVDDRGELLDYPLALRSMATFGYRPPGLVSFPPYFYRQPDIENYHQQLYEFVILQVSLDSAGSPAGRSVYYATDPSLGEMIQIASGWAEYSPAEIRGRRIPGEGYLFVRFFRELPSPVGWWRSTASDSADAGLERMRVSWIPGSQFGDVEPAPRANQKLQVMIPLSFSQNTEKEAQLRVDDGGRVNIGSLSGLTGKVDSRIALDKLRSISFYPAFRLTPDSSAQRLTFSYLSAFGRLKLIPLDSINYRLQTEFINDFNTLERKQTSGR